MNVKLENSIVSSAANAICLEEVTQNDNANNSTDNFAPPFPMDFSQPTNSTTTTKRKLKTLPTNNNDKEDGLKMRKLLGKSPASNKSTPSPSTSVTSVVSTTDCVICGDRATGKHYGSVSCDGCKGFFRRTIRKCHVYVCRFERNCVVDKDHRNTCRKCRFDKCLASGMRRDAVQLERDRISATIRHVSSPITPQASPQVTNSDFPAESQYEIHLSRIKKDKSMTYNEAGGCIQKLMDAETTMHQMRATVITRTADAYRTATTGDVTESMHQQLILMVEWAKQLEQFRSLPMSAQIGLLRHFSAQHLVICAAFRSIAVRDAVWLTNESCVPRDAPKIPDVNRVAARVLDHLTEPMRRLHLDEREYVALKAVAFFDPIAKGVEESAFNIQKTREQVLHAFEYHVTCISPHRDIPLRLANLLLLLPPIMAIARDLVEEAQLAKLFGLANVDELMAELLLPEDAENNTYQHLKTSVTTTVTSSNSLTNTKVTNQTAMQNINSLTTITSSNNEMENTPFITRSSYFSPFNQSQSMENLEKRNVGEIYQQNESLQTPIINTTTPTPSLSPIFTVANGIVDERKFSVAETSETSKYNGEACTSNINNNINEKTEYDIVQPSSISSVFYAPPNSPAINLLNSPAVQSTSSAANIYLSTLQQHQNNLIASQFTNLTNGTQFNLEDLQSKIASNANILSSSTTPNALNQPKINSPSCTFLSANSPFSSSASSPGMLGMGAAAAAAAAAAALCFVSSNRNALNVMDESINTNSINVPATIDSNSFSQNIGGVSNENIITPTPIYPATYQTTASLMSNILRDHQNNYLR